ncbi:hypothetical protein [Chryseobacterium sp. Leaf201]|uniref:hypothetical protein n=1 Tax=Chryseobacterium sp. Leaf201 TaxID=1735672 RepID=UPI0006F6EAF4|nr:hypothetical protein [Chryseobacterium sp. Leaf201]KQM45842.1 hypothetical protein ASE55_11780 [Chryseobacterium sp. Leaf201]
MKKWLISLLGLDKLSNEVTQIQHEISELNKIINKEILEIASNTRNLHEKLQASDSSQISTVLVSLNNKIDKLIPVKNEFSPSDLAIKDVLGNIVLNFSLKGADEIDLDKAKRVHGAALFATSAVNISAFQGISQNLFYATANPSTLMAIKGGLGTAVMGAKGIVSHAPFISAGLGAFAPILLFQATSMMIMQSSINNLAERVELVKKKVELLLKYTEKENEATLMTINEKLISLDKQKFYTTEDFVLLENFKDRLSVLSNQYRLLALESLISLSKKNSEVESENDRSDSLDVKKKFRERSLDAIVKLGKKVSKIADYVPHEKVSQFVSENIFELFRNSNGNVEKIKQEILGSKLQYFLVLSSTAENLSSQAKFLELKMNYAQINPDGNRIEKAKYLVERFKEDHLTLSSQNLSLLESVKQNITDQILELQNNSDWKRENIEVVKTDILKSFDETKTIIIKNQDEIYILKNSLNDQKSLELILEYKDGEENIYVLNA